MNSIDRLASIILNDHLPYFRYFQTPTRPEAREVREMNLNAHALWEGDLVRDASTAESLQKYEISRITCVFEAYRCRMLTIRFRAAKISL